MPWLCLNGPRPDSRTTARDVRCETSSSESLRKLRLQLFREFGEIDNHSLVGSSSDLLSRIVRLDPKFDSSPFALGDFRVGGDPRACRCRCPVNNVDTGAYSTFARIEVRLDGVKRSVLHHHDHDGRRKNGRQHRILETICEVVGIYDKAKGAFDANGYRSHVRIS